jgi:hypothetical protein
MIRLQIYSKIFSYAYLILCCALVWPYLHFISGLTQHCNNLSTNHLLFFSELDYSWQNGSHSIQQLCRTNVECCLPNLSACLLYIDSENKALKQTISCQTSSARFKTWRRASLCMTTSDWSTFKFCYFIGRP